MKVRRDVASVPIRSAADTWKAIVELVTSSDTIDRDQLDAAASIMCSIIADEHAAQSPFVFTGTSQRLVLYCKHGEDALELGLDLAALAFTPTTGDWRISAPTSAEDVAWMNRALEKRAPRISTRNDGDDVPQEASAEKAAVVEIDWGAFGLK